MVLRVFADVPRRYVELWLRLAHWRMYREHRTIHMACSSPIGEH